VITAASGTSFSLEDPQYKHGIFSWSILQGLNGQAEVLSAARSSAGVSRSATYDGDRAIRAGVKPDGIVTMSELFQYVVNDVPKLTRESEAGTQIPCFTPKPDVYPDLFAQELVRIKSSP
jgi:hypothetical protein